MLGTGKGKKDNDLRHAAPFPMDQTSSHTFWSGGGHSESHSSPQNATVCDPGRPGCTGVQAKRLGGEGHPGKP